MKKVLRFLNPLQVQIASFRYRGEFNSSFHAILHCEPFTELVQYSYALDTIGTSSDTRVSIVNPMFTEYSSLRTELMSGLIEAFQYNLEQGNGPLNGFEIGHIFWREEEGLAEGDALAGILGGDSTMGKMDTKNKRNMTSVSSITSVGSVSNMVRAN